jgi:hypothetical protein
MANSLLNGNGERRVFKRGSKDLHRARDERAIVNELRHLIPEQLRAEYRQFDRVGLQASDLYPMPHGARWRDDTSRGAKASASGRLSRPTEAPCE